MTAGSAHDAGYQHDAVFTYGSPSLKFGPGASEEIGFDLAAIVVDNVVAAPRHLQTARAHAAAVEELARHAAFVGGLTNPIRLA